MDVRQIKFNLDCSLMGNQKTIKGIRRGDANSIQLVIKLMNGHNTFSLKDDSQVVLYGIKPDGTKLCNTCSIDTDGNVVYILHTQDTTSIGTVEYQLVVSHKSGNKIKVIASPEFNCIVEDRLIYPTYTPLTDMPTDWSENYSNYYELVDGAFVKLTSITLGQWESGKYYSCDDGLVESSDEIDVLTNLIHKVNDLYAGCTIALDSDGKIVAFTDEAIVSMALFTDKNVKTIVFARNATQFNGTLSTISPLTDVYVYSANMYNMLKNLVREDTAIHMIETYNYTMPILKTAGSSNIAQTSINDNGELVFSFSNGTTTNLGVVVGTNGQDGENGTNGVDGKDGVNGKDGVSPEITVVHESDTDYCLQIKDVNGAFTTPNLKGDSPYFDVGVGVDDGSNYILYFVNGSKTIETPNLKGTNGKNGTDGKDGEDGVSVIKSEINEAGELVITYSDDTSSNLGVVVGANGQDGADGKDGTNGTDGVNGQDGVSCTHSFDGTVLTVTSASGTSFADLKGEKGDKGDKGDQGIQGETGPQGLQGEKGENGSDGKDGYTPVKGKDYFTEADKTELVNTLKDTCIEKNQGFANVGKILVVGTDGNLTLTDMPEGGTSGDVTGILDESNNILLSGNLADGTYTLKYENTDGTYTDIGTLEVGTITPTYTNLADPTSADWAVTSRFSSAGVVTTASGTNADISNYIPISRGSVVRVKGMTLTNKIGSSSCRQALYTLDGSNKVFLAVADTSSTHVGYVSTDDNGVSTITISDALITALGINYEPYFIRLNGILTGTKEDVIITVDEPIS